MSIQDAVDAANDGDVIKVAAGTYIDMNNYGGLAQVVYIDKSVTIRGGYTTAFTDPPDPEANPTTLDAQGQGRVLYITGNINPTIEGLRITGGDAAGLGNGWWWGGDVGGGVYVVNATAIIRDNQVFGNTADYGGGLCLDESAATLSDNAIFSNTASGTNWRNGGGGLFLGWSDATLSGNTISNNTANWNGGGLFLVSSAATLDENTISSNIANKNGGGL